MQKACTDFAGLRRCFVPHFATHINRKAWQPFQGGCRQTLTCQAKTGQDSQQSGKVQEKTLSGKKETGKPLSSEQVGAKWGFFNLAEYNKPWQVPWGKKETALGFLGWVLTFLLVSLLTIPGVLQVTGKSITELSHQEQVGYVLVNQILETGFGIWIVLYLLRNYQPLPKELFSISLKNPLRKPDGWLVWGCLGFLLAPIVVSVVLDIFTFIGYTEEGPSTVDEVVKIITPDAISFAGLFGVTSILAPILEEFVFRGFLLTSLSSFLPVPLAIAGSSSAFGLAHLSIKDFPELTALGVLLACSYIRSRNLMTPIMIHGLWNGAVLIVLFAFPELAQ